MELEISIEDLLNKRRVESDRIEFKAGWNPDDIYHSVCAFANDFDNVGGGYILIGVEEKNGIAVRPVKGVEEQEIDKIQKEIFPLIPGIFFLTGAWQDIFGCHHILAALLKKVTEIQKGRKLCSCTSLKESIHRWKKNSVR